MSRTVITNENIREFVKAGVNGGDLPDDLIDLEMGDWDVSQVTNMDDLFNKLSMGSNARHHLHKWDVTNVTSMKNMFSNCDHFNDPIGNWNVSNVKNMAGMFSGAVAFNQPIGSWNVSRVKNMAGMFSGASRFNQPIEQWDVSNVADMSDMFNNAESFSQPVEEWGVYLLGLFSSPSQVNHYHERINSNVKIVQTYDEFMRMCKSADKTEEECKQKLCPICIGGFIFKKHLIRPVMFHKIVVDRRREGIYKEMWVDPVHPEEQVEWGDICPSCKQKLLIPNLQIDEINREKGQIIKNANDKLSTLSTLALQSAIRGHLTRNSKEVRRAKEYTINRREFHDRYVKDKAASTIQRATRNHWLSRKPLGGKRNKTHVRKVKTLRRTRKCQIGFLKLF